MAAKQQPEDNPYQFGEAGLSLWREYTSSFALDASDVQLLKSTCEVADLVHDLDRITREHGPLDGDGRVASHVQEARFQRALLLKLTAQLTRLAEPVGTGNRKNMGGSRAPYAVRQQ